ncbi:diphosphomevalonate decarboxylase [Saccharicrinis fermentans]|uniref:diphosphomevalonate decarboxylase n=1 Tax=Saccharicrinis fermentans DSM 9555 = JCM 21142 TaxID=869213 RepID=W7Y4S2_9BACT|nr:diphosphomevalonate decarboxylase [Saccharicrinis fermentans]GAF03082.1 mevalonate pyrophosphate decarboxylase [Saccharicrinis fermentans DSM 9555 = JCM 21142]
MTITEKQDLSEGSKIHVTSPSNIAIVKYWGKTGMQIPLNPSVSFSLKHSITDTSISYTFHPGQENISFRLIFAGKENTTFKKKTEVFFKRILQIFPWLVNFHLNIESKNTFPHSSGIASSASSYAALAICLSKIHQQITGQQLSEQQISNVARLGSGSACRSIYGGWNSWGKSKLKQSSNMHAIHLQDNIHPSFTNIQDSILIVSEDQKKVSSTLGHQLMEGHPYREGRIQQANEHTNKLFTILKTGDWNAFVTLAETEALSLHALMMSSTPNYTLLLPNSLNIVQQIRIFREQNNIPVCFTIDAGPNIHVLYPAANKKQVQEFIHNNLMSYCVQGNLIHDELGDGPAEIL